MTRPQTASSKCLAPGPIRVEHGALGTNVTYLHVHDWEVTAKITRRSIIMFQITLWDDVLEQTRLDMTVKAGQAVALKLAIAVLKTIGQSEGVDVIDPTDGA